jgi:hypothetical protein
VSDAYLESLLLGACPELRDSWRAHRHTFTGTDAADDQLLLDAVRRHVLGLLAAARVAEFSRFARAIERVLGDADPLLFELLSEGLLQPLARDVREAGIAPSLVAPYLGRRTELAWPQG